MSLTIHTLIWLFPVAFIIHDIEELIFLGPWLKNNAGDIRGRLPAFFVMQLDAMMRRSTSAVAIAMLLAFGLAALSSLLATAYPGIGYFIFLPATAMFFVHGFGHIGQSIVLRRSVPGLVTSILVVIPYGLVLFARLLTAGILGWTGLIACCFLGTILFIPFILSMLKFADLLCGTR